MDDMFWPRLFPKTLRSIHEFAEQEVELPKGPRRGMMFDLDFMPFLRFAFDAIMNPYWRKVAIVGPTQSGKSLVANNIPMLYFLFEAQEDVIVGIPNMDLAKGIWTEKVRPVIAGTRYKEFLPTQGSGARGGVPGQIQFRNGVFLRFIGAGGNPAQQSSHTARIILMSEIDKMDDSGDNSDEADPVSLIENRADSFAETSKIILECTVTHEEGRIWQEAMVMGSGGRIFVPCPSCGGYQILDISHLQFDDRDELSAEESARYICEHCEAAWTDDDRLTALRTPAIVHRGQSIDELGSVTGDLPRTRTFGMHYSVLYSPMQSIGKTAAQAMKVEQSDNKEMKKAFVQSKLAMPWHDEEIDGNRLSWSFLSSRRKASACSMGTVPDWADWLIMTVDVQKRWLYWHCDAYKENSTSQVIEYGVVDIVDESDNAIRKALDEVLDVSNGGWPGVDEARHIPRLNLVDTGYRYDVIGPWLRGRSHWFGCKGVGRGLREKITGEKSVFEIPGIVQIRRQKDMNLIWFIMVDDTKGIVHDRYFIQDPDSPGYTFVPCDITDGYIKSLTAEVRKESTKGEGFVWEKIRRRNDYLDCRSYSVAAAMYIALREGKSQKRIAARAEANKQRLESDVEDEQETKKSFFPRNNFMIPSANKGRRKQRTGSNDSWFTHRGRYFT